MSLREADTLEGIIDPLSLPRYLFERSPLPLVAVEGFMHVVRYVNPAFCRLAEQIREDLIGKPYAAAVPEGKENGCIPVLDRVYRTGEAESLAHQQHRQTTSEPSYWSYAVWAILNANDLPAGVMIQVADTTETALFRRRVVAMNQELILSGIRQHELTEVAERATRRVNQAMRETDHRVKNNLQSIAALLDMQIMSNAVGVRMDELTQLRLHINTLASIHDMLTQDLKGDATASIMSCKEAFRNLLPLLQQLVGAERIQWSADDLYLPIKQGMSVAMLINELVCNAVKHGGHAVGVRLATSEKTVTLKVWDDGPGFPEAFNPRTAAHCGLDLVESVSRLDLGGTATYANRPDGGACVTVTFPIT
jgi:two-component sensor histidine kinase